MSLALNETQPKSATCSEVTAILKMHVQNLGYPLSLQIWGPTQKTTFLGRLGNLTAILTAYIVGIKHDIGLDNRATALTTTGGLLHRLKIS